MYLARLEIENFRIFGDRGSESHLALDLLPGLNLLLGENDSGKTCIVDALRLVLGTLPVEHFAPTTDDFHCDKAERAKRLSIRAHLRGLTEHEAATFLEHITMETLESKAEYCLVITLTAERDENSVRPSRRSPVKYELRSGLDEEGPRFEGPARELLRATYLRPMRDAVAELTARKGSRLAQILNSYPEIAEQHVNDWNPDQSDCTPKTLMGIMRRAEHSIRGSDVIKKAEAKLNDAYLKPFSIGDTPIKGQIGITHHELRQILERLELTLADHAPGATRGLGLHNILFMAAELLALERDNAPCLPLVLIEEPESHLHPQLQMRLVEFFRKEAKGSKERAQLQILLTSHSPNIASKVGVADVTLLHKGQAFPLRPDVTRLDPSDYAFLNRFLDVTRADMFFARGLLVVEGDAEAILLPTIAELIGCRLTESGVSVINVGSVGLFRYARIFQRADGRELPIRVACLADRDIPPDEAKWLVGQRETAGQLGAKVQAKVEQLRAHDSGSVKTFVSDHWTLEFDLACAGLARDLYAAILLAKATKSRQRSLTRSEYLEAIHVAFNQHKDWKEEGKSQNEIATLVYAPLYNKQASKTEAAQFLAGLLHSRARRPEFGILDKLPPYLIDGIRYATQRDAPVSAPAATPEEPF